MSKHTPGPWQTDIDGKTAYVVDADGNMAVCKVMYARPEGPANTRLIAQAPRLLEALKAVVRVADRATVEFDEARAAIAAATEGDSHE